MSESSAKREALFLEALGSAFVDYCRKHAAAPGFEEFASFLSSRGMAASVSLIYRMEAGAEVYYSERAQSSAIYWRVRLGAWSCLLPRPVNHDHFSEPKDFTVAFEHQVGLTPASLGECTPAVLEPFLQDDWKIKSVGSLKAGAASAFSRPRTLPAIRVTVKARAGPVPPPPSSSGMGSAGAANAASQPLAADAVARTYVAFCAAVCAGEEQAQVDDLCKWIGRSLGVQSITREEVRFGGLTPAEQGFWPCSHFEYPHPEPDAWLLAWCGAAQQWEGLLLPVIKDKCRFSRSPVAFAPHDQTPDSLVWVDPGQVTQLAHGAWQLAIKGRLLGLPVGVQDDLAQCYHNFRANGPRSTVAPLDVPLSDFAAWISWWFDRNADAQKRLGDDKPEVWPVGPYSPVGASVGPSRRINTGLSVRKVEPGHENYWLVYFPVTRIGAMFPAFNTQAQNLEDIGAAFRRVSPELDMESGTACSPALARLLPGEQPILLEVLRKGRITSHPDTRTEQPGPFWKRWFRKKGQWVRPKEGRAGILRLSGEGNPRRSNVSLSGTPGQIDELRPQLVSFMKLACQVARGMSTMRRRARQFC